MPNEFPWFPFFVDDFCSDGKVEAMSAAEVGAYVLLLCKAWKEKPRGSIPNDDAVLARWTRLDPVHWAECKLRVLACFSLSPDGRWHQKRMVLEARKLSEKSNKFKEAGKQGAKRRWSKGGEADSHPNGQANGQAIATPSRILSDCKCGSDSPSPGEGKKGVVGESEEGFAAFWAAYPRKQARRAALRAWKRIRPPPELVAVILASVEKQKQSAQWRKGVIAHASTWLNGHRWEDEELVAETPSLFTGLKVWADANGVSATSPNGGRSYDEG